MHTINLPNGGLNGYRWTKAADGTWTFTVYTDEGETTCLDITGFELTLVVNPISPLVGTQIVKTSGDGIAIQGTYDPDPRLNTQRAVVTWAPDDTAGIGFPAGPWHATLWRSDTDNVGALAEGPVYLMELDTIP